MVQVPRCLPQHAPLRASRKCQGPRKAPRCRPAGDALSWGTPTVCHCLVTWRGLQFFTEAGNRSSCHTTHARKLHNCFYTRFSCACQQRLARVSSAPKPACQTEPHIGAGRIPSLRGEHEQPRPAGSTAGHKGEGGSRSCHAAAAATQPWPFQVPRAAACCPLPGLRHLDVPLLWRTSRASHRDPRPQRMPIRVGSAPR